MADSKQPKAPRLGLRRALGAVRSKLKVARDQLRAVKQQEEEHRAAADAAAAEAARRLEQREAAQAAVNAQTLTRQEQETRAMEDLLGRDKLSLEDLKTVLQPDRKSDD